MIYPEIPLAQTVIQLCKAKGIKHIIISPGSRNAPLTIGFTNAPFFKCYSIVDERCAAFFAMGMAQQLREATALVCTSGSALLNYYPAISEAFYSDIPLVVLSADRPKHFIDIGDGQTINQEYVFKNHILYSANLNLGLQTYNEEEINTAINLAILENGPVHINIPFDEPLYNTVDELSVSPKNIEINTDQNDLEDASDDLVKAWNSASKKMILVGVNQPNVIDQKHLEELAKDDSVIVLTETTSNIHHDSFFSSIDQLISPLSQAEQQDIQPDIFITFGGLIVSKRIKTLLRKKPVKQHWHIDTKKAYDTFFCLTEHIKINPNQFFESFLTKISKGKKSNYKATWSAIKDHRLNKHEDYLKTIPFSDFVTFENVLKSIPDHSVLQVSNSSAIRYTQLFTLNKTLEIYCNRGTSGIDGSTSTAIGSAVATEKQTTFITGDLSFFYDSNALWNNYIPNNFRIIVINNQGGGIFRILPGHKNTENFDQYFETKHSLTAEHLCKMYGFAYETSSNTSELKSTLDSFYVESESPKLLEVFTPSRINDEVLLEYFKFIK